MKTFKKPGGNSRLLVSEMKAHCETIGSTSEENIIKYIERQKQC